jgi:glycerophosphoryl diester phosphodiesterase|tara:strand:- start:168 stop:1061 length:894 start_codon:yes stop_codon:yes gene_type:complete
MNWKLSNVTFFLIATRFINDSLTFFFGKRVIHFYIIICLLVGCEYADENDFTHIGITAHRGNSLEYPENTIPAFQSAISLGVDWMELDIHKTKDGQIVVIHDYDTGNLGNRNLKVAEVTYDELKAVDMAYEFRIRNKLTFKECPPASVPLLSDIIKLVMQQNGTRLSIQPKTNCGKEAMDIIKALNAEAWVGFNDDSVLKMKEVKEKVKSIPVFWDRPGDTNIDEDLKTAQIEGFESIVIYHFGITKEKVDKIHEAGLEVGAHTVNEPARIKVLLGLGVDRFYTDDPHRLMQLLGRK